MHNDLWVFGSGNKAYCVIFCKIYTMAKSYVFATPVDTPLLNGRTSQTAPRLWLSGSWYAIKNFSVYHEMKSGKYIQYILAFFEVKNQGISVEFFMETLQMFLSKFEIPVKELYGRAWTRLQTLYKSMLKNHSSSVNIISFQTLVHERKS